MARSAGIGTPCPSTGSRSAQMLDAAGASLDASHPIPFTGRFGTSSGYFYVDTCDRFGHHLEYIYMSPEYGRLIPRGQRSLHGLPPRRHSMSQISGPIVTHKSSARIRPWRLIHHTKDFRC